jgi:transcriptional regulator with XRE-family HTH domain
VIIGGKNMRLAENLRILRRSEDISQEEISERLNVTRQTISKWVNGQSQPSIEMLVELANWFEVSIDDLIRGNLSNNKKALYTDSNLLGIQERLPIISEDKDDEEDVVCPRIGLEGLNSYLSFKTAMKKN